jgi:hypothetical protein
VSDHVGDAMAADAVTCSTRGVDGGAVARPSGDDGFVPLASIERSPRFPRRGVNPQAMNE